MDASRERSIAERASRQLSLITLDQLNEIGLDKRAARRLVLAGRFEPGGSRTWRLAGSARTFEQDVLAACLELGAVASHRTAGYLHGLTGFTTVPAVVEVTVRHDIGRNRAPGARVHRTTNLPSDDLVACGPIPATSVARTILGLAALAPKVDVGALRNAVDEAVRDGLASDRWLYWRLERLRCRGRNGVKVLEAILQDRAGKGATESWLEREFLRLVAIAGLPRPVVQRRIQAKGAFVARVDCFYEDEGLVVELHGHRSHSTRRQLAADAARTNRLQLLGHQVLVFTYDHMVEQADFVVATLRDALARSPVSPS